MVGGHVWGPFWNGEGAMATTHEFLLRAVPPSGQAAEAIVRAAGRAGLLFAKAQVPFARDIEPEVRDKHLHDVYYLLRTWPGGTDAAAMQIGRELGEEAQVRLVDSLGVAFERRTSMGPLAVARGVGAAGATVDRVLTESLLTVQRVVRKLGRAPGPPPPGSDDAAEA